MNVMNLLAEEDEEVNQVLSICVALVELYYKTYIDMVPCMTSIFTGNVWLMELLEGNEIRCHNMLRMSKDVFLRLCGDLENVYHVKASRRMSVAEKLGMFLYTLGEGVGNRNIQERFQHSGETVSHYFSELLDVTCVMAQDLIKPFDPEFRSTPPEILRDTRYMPHFKDCIGAIDGVHVNAKITPNEQVPYIGRKGMSTQNIMAVCNFDMQFTFAYAGWEGTAHDTRIFQSAINNPTLNFPKPPNGKYYLVDAGYPQMKGYLGPYKCQRYHLPEFRRGAQPTGYKEVFNHAHSSLRSVIECTFGVRKKQWNILRDMPTYPFEKQVKIVLATMALHNYIRRYAHRDCVFDESENLDDDGEIDRELEAENNNAHVSREMEVLRNNIASSLIGAPIGTML